MNSSGHTEHPTCSPSPPASSAELLISAITIHELEHGVLLMERPEPAQGALLRAWLDGLVELWLRECKAVCRWR